MSAVCVCAEPLRGFRGRSEASEFEVPEMGFRNRAEAGRELFEDFVKENFPDDAEEILSWLEMLKDYKPDEYGNKIRESVKKIRMLKKVKDKDPEKYERHIKDFKLTIKCAKLGKEYKEAETEKEKGRIKDELKEVLVELFESKQAENEERIKQIEEKLSELKEKNSTRKEHREEIVNRRLEQIIASASGLGW